jgi:hypothetical protein
MLTYAGVLACIACCLFWFGVSLMACLCFSLLLGEGLRGYAARTQRWQIDITVVSAVCQLFMHWGIFCTQLSYTSNSRSDIPN